MKRLFFYIALFTGTATFAQENLSNFKPVLESTLKRAIPIDPAKGYTIMEVKPGSGIYVLTDGVWQSAAMVTASGVVLIDAPESFGKHIQQAVREVTDKPITKLIYTHSHIDHIGGSQYLKDIKNLEIIALKSTADYLDLKKDPRRLLPTRTFSGSYTVKQDGKEIQLSNPINYHSNEGNIFVYLPQAKVLMAVDAVEPGYTPFMSLDITSNVFTYMQVFDKLLAFDFDVFIGGHLTSLGDRKNIIQTKEYVTDVYNTVKRVNTNTDAAKVIAAAAARIGWDNKYLLLRVVLDKVIDESAKELIAKWSDKLPGVDIWARSHAEAMLVYVRWND